jgi:hypothetical protein
MEPLISLAISRFLACCQKVSRNTPLQHNLQHKNGPVSRLMIPRGFTDWL